VFLFRGFAAAYENCTVPFLKTTDVQGRSVWAFAHPTITDALTDILKARSHMVGALVRGAALETILRTVVCEGAQPVPDAPIVPATLDDVLVARFTSIRDEEFTNRLMFNFLAHRANENVFRRVVTAHPELLNRYCWQSHTVRHAPKVLTHARAYGYGALDVDIQDSTASELETAALDQFDLSFFDEPDVLRLMPSRRAIALGIRLRTQTLPDLSDRIRSAGEEADTSDTVGSVFGRFEEGLDTLEGLGNVDAETEQMISDARDALDEAKDLFRERKAADEDEDHSAEWNYMAPAPSKEPDADDNIHDTRSVFSDVDH
jgi:hypothetical protein